MYSLFLLQITTSPPIFFWAKFFFPDVTSCKLVEACRFYTWICSPGNMEAERSLISTRYEHCLQLFSHSRVVSYDVTVVAENMTPCRFLNRYQRYGRTFCLWLRVETLLPWSRYNYVCCHFQAKYKLLWQRYIYPRAEKIGRYSDQVRNCAAEDCVFDS